MSCPIETSSFSDRTHEPSSIHSSLPQTPDTFGMPPGDLRQRLYRVIFEADTEAGRRFDLFLIGAILLSVLVVMLESVHAIRTQRGAVVLDVLE
jgi:voltage-gated potassium channel